MSMLPVPANPFFYSQYQLQGGHKATSLVTAAYAVLIGAAIYFSTLDHNGVHRPAEVARWASMLLGLQFFVLVLYGTYRVDSAVRTDVTQKMLESHRLMPITPMAAVIGYTIGAPFGSICLGVVNFVLGLMCCAYGGESIDNFMIATVVICIASYCAWCVVMQYAFFARGGFLILLVLGGILIASEGEIASQLPPLRALLYPLLLEPVFDLSRGRTSEIGILTSIVAELLIIGICIRAAVRRYRASDVVGISPISGVLLVLTSAGLTIMSICYADSFHGMRYYDSFRSSQMVSSYVTGWTICLLLAMLPLAALAKQSTLFNRNLGTENPRSYLGVPAVIFALLFPLLALAPVIYRHWSTSFEELSHDTVFFGIIVVLYVVGTWFLFRLTYLMKILPWPVAIFWTLLTWVGPTLIQLLVKSFSETREYTPVIGLSPIAAMGLRLSHDEVALWPGLIGQAVIAMVPAGLYVIASQRRKEKAKVLP